MKGAEDNQKGLVSRQAYFVLAAEAEGEMRYLAGPIALVTELGDALRFLTLELAQARLGAAAGLAADLDWRIVPASTEIRLDLAARAPAGAGETLSPVAKRRPVAGEARARP